jgi:hypothetical protein
VKDILLVHDSAVPHTSLRTCEAVTKKMRWTVLPHPARSPGLAPSNYHLFGRHFAEDGELKQSFHGVLRI